MSPIHRSLPLFVALALAAPSAGAQGRPLRVTGQHDLTFGSILPGVAVTIRPTDASRSAQLQIAGPKLAQVVLTFSLPPSMTSPSGDAMPLTFGPTSAGYSPTGSVADETLFDPSTPITVTLDGNGRGVVFLGATLRPSGGQRAGNYSASLTLTLSPSGL
ncbi:MAG TPA: DUF4402 domain-containing protein [Gemmatimonadaceae bacterium]|nr:DUF4402 domain-containing protein [Gemmatimonadaceae bacterium]